MELFWENFCNSQMKKVYLTIADLSWINLVKLSI